MDNEIIIAILGSGVLSTLISNVFSLLKDSRHQRKVNAFLLLGELKRGCQEYKAIGHISYEELQSYTELYELYKAEGGNGYAELLLDQVKRLPND